MSWKAVFENPVRENMDKRFARRLHNRDQVEVRVGREWIPGYVLGDPSTASMDGAVYVDVQTEIGLLYSVRHTDLR